MPGRDPGPLRTLGVALAVCAACSVMVSTTAVLLAPRQRANREAERRRHVRALLERQPGLAEMLGDLGTARLREVVVDLGTPHAAAGTLAEPSAGSREGGLLPLSAADDIAGIGSRPDRGAAFLVTDDERLVLVLLPVHGAGYASVLRGYVALGPDANTVRGLTFYEHAETPGVGGEILADEEWLGSWTGRRVRDADGRVRIGTSPRELDPGEPEAEYQVDAVSGATRTTMGVGNLLRFWLGDLGYGPFLRRLAEEGAPR